MTYKEQQWKGNSGSDQFTTCQQPLPTEGLPTPQTMAESVHNLGFKHFFYTLLRALIEERHFALVERFAIPANQGSRNQLQVRYLDPTHASLRRKLRS
jgi:hypothetical protein